jgi:DNA-binding transcriptional LysR family regulator
MWQTCAFASRGNKRDANTGLHERLNRFQLSRLLTLANACEIDFAIASRPIQDPRMEVKDLFAEELRLALPPRHSLTRKRTVRLADLEKEPFIVMKEGHCLGESSLTTLLRPGTKS